MKKNPYAIKMSSEDFQLYIYFKKRGGKSALKKGKGSYDRKKAKREMVKGWQEMTIGELRKYIEYAMPDLDVVVLDRKTYDRIMRKAMTLDAISDKLRIASKLVDKAMK